jgi:hypothetical protein
MPSVDLSALSASDNAWHSGSKFPYREIPGAIGYVALGTRPDVLYSYKSHGRWASNYDRPHVPAHFGAVHVFDQGPIANAEHPLQSSASLMQIGQAVALHSVQVAG